jgi:hypothetical protein
VSGIAKNAPKTMHVSFFHNKYGKKKIKRISSTIRVGTRKRLARPQPTTNK